MKRNNRPPKAKELLGFVASKVLRCDDCVTHHVIHRLEEGVTAPEFFDAFNVALVVEGSLSITIQHLRRDVERLGVQKEGLASSLLVPLLLD
jgi:AhpD family alkylhydroperoxidase